MDRIAPPERPAWMRRAERGNRFALLLMRAISLRLGRRVARLLLPFIAAYFALAVAPARRAARDFLARALGRPASWRDVLRNFHAFASTVHDRVYLTAGRHALFDIRVYGGEALQQRARAGGVLLLGSHLGSFDVARAMAAARAGPPLYMAMYPANARMINATLAAIDPRTPAPIIELGCADALVRVHQRLAEGAIVGVLADRAAGRDRYCRLPFLGVVAPFPTGPFRLARVLGCPVYFMAGIYRGANRYDLHFEPLQDAPSEARAAAHRQQADLDLLRRYVAVLERHCREAPYNWFNFYDFWSTSGESAGGAPPA